MEWLMAMRGQVTLCLEGKRRLQRMRECFHDDCGFENCVMFGMYHVVAGMWRCEICHVIDGYCANFCEGATKRRWNMFVRGIAKCRKCGWRCQDRRVDMNEWKRMNSSKVIELPERYQYSC